MRKRKPLGEMDDGSGEKRMRAGSLYIGKPQVTFAESGSLPAGISNFVGNYLPIDERYHVKTAFAVVQPITLCLSQDIETQLASHWSIGFLSPSQLWEPSSATIDKQYPIKDSEGCLQLFEQKNSNCCPVAIAVLVVRLSASQESPLALDALRKTIKELKEHLSSVKHVVISIQEYAFCCFTLNDATDNATGFPQPLDHLLALYQIVDDLQALWERDPSLQILGLLTFYFNSGAKPVSESYLENLVIPLNTVHAQILYSGVPIQTWSHKIKLVCSLTSADEVSCFNQNAPLLCHAFRFDLSGMKDDELLQFGEGVPDILQFQDNLVVERIVINSKDSDRVILLPSPSAALTDGTSFSALIELSLTGYFHTFDLSQLNNGYFPHLAHLSIVGGEMKGHLDSYRVPSLKTLRIELGSDIEISQSLVGSLPREHTQTLIDTGFRWQLAAFSDQKGWSLASYDVPFADSEDDVKGEFPHSPHLLPVIKDLMFVLSSVENCEECQSLLDSFPAQEAATGSQKDSLLVWTQESVEKITAFATAERLGRLTFEEEIPERTRILTSLTGYSVNLVLHGPSLSSLQSLKVNSAYLTLEGDFPQLRMLSLEYGFFQSSWQLKAPLLQTLRCIEVGDGNMLFLSPKTLPHLSHLWVEPYHGDHKESPVFHADVDPLALSRVNYALFGKGMTKTPLFKRYPVHCVSHLELTVNVIDLPAFWFKTEWQCETLTINAYVKYPQNMHLLGDIGFMMPPQLPRVKKLTVTTEECRVLLDSKMPELTDCKVPSSISLGPNLRCPKLTCIRFTDQLSESDKEKCLDRATYVAIGARPSWVYFVHDSEVNSISWDVPSSATGSSAFVEPLEDGGDSSLSLE